ncbi:MAG TPA: DUF1501 domain-containing protein [Pirellulales bacterium]|nr:DUF1501 domain-containing protein [Pirellulales bacterium]
MFFLYGLPQRGGRQPTRRELLRVGALSLLGLSSARLSRLRAAAADDPSGAARRRHSCVFVFLFGGPSHIDLWDMKPQAPAEVRGEFKPAATKAPGLELCEHLPLLAGQADKLCLLRSMTHHMPVHGPACSEMYTGREYFGPPTTDQALPEDWPSISSLAARFAPPNDGLPPSIVLPWYSQFDGQSKRIAGQTGGRMGDRFNPLLIDGDPSRLDFEVQGLKTQVGVSDDRLGLRRRLLDRLTAGAEGSFAAEQAAAEFAAQRETAFSLLAQSQLRSAFELQQEPAALRERYGYSKLGQSLLLARRLIEAGGSLVTVNWDDESKHDKVSPFWDTHHDNFAKLKNHLCPIFDRAFAAFLEDLHLRGLLQSTLVVVTGEFGRTPKIGQFVQNGMTQKTGRDHWPHAFTVLLAGGGVRGGQVYGATSKTGGYVDDAPISPADLAATIFWHLGIDGAQSYFDEFQRIEQQICEGRPIRDL